MQDLRASPRARQSVTKNIKPPLKFDPTNFINSLKGVFMYEQIQNNLLLYKELAEEEEQQAAADRQRFHDNATMIRLEEARLGAQAAAEGAHLSASPGPTPPAASHLFITSFAPLGDGLPADALHQDHFYRDDEVADHDSANFRAASIANSDINEQHASDYPDAQDYARRNTLGDKYKVQPLLGPPSSQNTSTNQELQVRKFRTVNAPQPRSRPHQGDRRVDMKRHTTIDSTDLSKIKLRDAFRDPRNRTNHRLQGRRATTSTTSGVGALRIARRSHSTSSKGSRQRQS